MKIDEIGGHKIERVDSAHELLAPRYMNFNRLVIIDSGIGSDLSALNQHDKMIIEYAKRGDFKKIIQETKNRNLCIQNVMRGLSPSHMAYIQLIHKIDGVLLTDFTDENAIRLVELFGKWGAKSNFFTSVIETLKKKFEAELDQMIPDRHDNPKEKEYYINRKRRLRLICKSIYDKANAKELELQRINDFLYSLAKPEAYSGNDGFEIKYMRNYEDMSFILSQHTGTNPKSMTIIEYLKAWGVVVKQQKPK